MASGPINGGVSEITPSDTAFDPPLRSVFVGTAGDLDIEWVDGTAVVLPNVAAGIWHPMAQVSKIKAANTTAVGIFGSTSQDP